MEPGIEPEQENAHTTTPPTHRRRSRRGVVFTAAAAGAVVVALGACEAMGWPFLAAPLQQRLADALQRPVRLGDDAAHPSARLHLLGRVELRSPSVFIGPPSWSKAPHTVLARDVALRMGYGDVWRAWRGDGLHLALLRAATLDAHLERLADGRATWQLAAPKEPRTPAPPPGLGVLYVGEGKIAYRDAVLAMQADATIALDDGGARREPSFRLEARGRYRELPMTVSLRTNGVLPLLQQDRPAPDMPVQLQARVGRASMSFIGTASDALQLGGLKGRYDVRGPSLAAVGDPLHVTLPTTGPFETHGLIAKDGAVWSVVPEQIAIGSSRLSGAFRYDARPARPVLSGKLAGERLLLADLGPAFGARASKTEASHAAPGRLLPDRPFDLPSLRAMDANVLIDIASADLGSQVLSALEPLRARLILDDGLLRLDDIDARTAQGRLAGTVQVDGRREQALWHADMRWADVRLEQWLHPTRGGDAPPYVTGRLSGRLNVDGVGRSTAAMLASLRGTGAIQLADATISHLAVEAAGLDVAQALGMLVKGDDSLPVQCTVADLTVDKGLVRPRALVLDTPDSTLWIDGSVSLATERMDLRLVASPKDFSPLALRSPVHVAGTFANPSYSVDKGKLGAKLGAAALLSLVNPIAALIPLVDTGDGDVTRRGGEDCKSFARRITGSGSGAKGARAASTPPKAP